MKKIKTMNSKTTKNSQQSTTEPKNKQTKNKTDKVNKKNKRITEMEVTWRVIGGEREVGKWGEMYRE